MAELEGISHSFDERPVIKDFSTTVMRGDRIGIVGANGAGTVPYTHLTLPTIHTV